MNFFRELIRYFTSFLQQIFSFLRFLKLDKLWGWLGKKTGRRMPGLSLPARAAWLTFLFLAICVATFFFAAIKPQGTTVLGKLLTRNYIAVIVILVIAIPIVVYKTLKLYLEGEGTLYPDIEDAWQAGIEELERQRIDLTQVPMYLMLGCGGEAQAQALFEGSQMELAVRSVPQGKAPLYWFASQDAVYVVCTEVGAECLLSRVARTAPMRAAAEAAPGAARPRDLRQTLVAGDDSDVIPGVGSAPPQPAFDIRGTMEVAQVRETIIGAAATGPKLAEPVEQRIVVDRAERERELSRLETVCRRIARARKPFCPVNGALMVLPYKVLESKSGAGEMTVAVENDLRVATRVFRQRFGVVALVTGLEEERGFQELVRRVGQGAATGQRFGHKYDAWKAPIPEQMEALCAHACGAFEDWVYSLFRKDDALKKKSGNELLYSLLCKIRGKVQLHLEKVLVEGFGYDPDQIKTPYVDRPLFAGCYFAATGEREDRRAFLGGVVRDKLLDHANDVEWTPDAIEYDQRCYGWAKFFIGLDALLLVALLFVLYVAYWWK